MKVFSPFLLVALCASLSANSFATGKVYKWTDAKGVVHYGQQPPTSVPKEVVPLDIGPSAPSSAAPEPTQQNSSTPAQGVRVADDKSDPEEQRVRCENSRKNVEALRTFTHIKIKGEDGQYRYLTPDEQKQKLEEATLAVKLNCEDSSN